MPSENLFESHTKRRINFKAVAIGVVALVVIVGAAFGVYRYTKPEMMTADDYLAEDIRNNTLLMLDYSTFSGDEFRKQILGKGKLEKFNRRTNEAYFTFPKTDEAEFNEFTAKYFYHPSKLEFGKEKDGKIDLGTYKMPVSPEAPRFFKTSLDNIRLDTAQTVSFPFYNVTYTASLRELSDLTSNLQVYGGRLMTQAPTRRDEPQFVFANHGIMVAKPDEPSMKRLSEDLVKDIGPNREARIQRLVDFVSSEIEYSYTEAVGSRETLKRGSETLMTRTGDCSNKTILLASLLEQIGEEYVLLYCPRHITVAIPQGNYPNNNKLDFTWNGKPWLIAETTLSGFQVGKTRVTQANILTKVEYVQNQKNADVIFDANSYEVLKFL